MTRVRSHPIPSCPARPARVLAAALLAVGLAIASAAQADSGRSLNDARNSVNLGTSSGVVLIPARKPAASAPAASAPAAAAPAAAAPAQAAGTANAANPAPPPATAGAGAGKGNAAAPAATSAPRAAAGAAPPAPGSSGGGVGAAVSGFLAGLRQAQPPSGDPLRAAKRLTSDELGVPLPTAASPGPQAAASAPAR